MGVTTSEPPSLDTIFGIRKQPGLCDISRDFQRQLLFLTKIGTPLLFNSKKYGIAKSLQQMEHNNHYLDYPCKG